MRNIICHLVWLSFVVLDFQSCNKDSVIPAYVYIPAITVGGTNAFGSFSSKITDAWIYQGDSLQGAYQLPCHFPMRASGLITLNIGPGIKIDGIAATRAEYPFYSDTTMVVNLIPGKTDTLYPVVHYFSYTKMAFDYNFDNGGFPSGIDVISSPPEDVFEGHSSGKIHIPDTISLAYCFANAYAIPPLTTAAFLEMNYKCDYPFTVGINGYVSSTGVTTPVDVETLNAQSPPQWNKIYIDLTPTLNQAQPDSTTIYFYVSKSNLTDQPNIYLDNIKLLYIQP